MLRIAIAIPAGAEGQPATPKGAGGPGFSVALRSLSGAPSETPSSASASPPDPAKRQGLAGSGKTLPPAPDEVATGKTENDPAPSDDPETRDHAAGAQIAFAWHQPLATTADSVQGPSSIASRTGSRPTTATRSAPAVPPDQAPGIADTATDEAPTFDAETKTGADPDDAARRLAGTSATGKRPADAGAKGIARPDSATIAPPAQKAAQAPNNSIPPSGTEAGDVAQQWLAAARTSNPGHRTSPTATADPATTPAGGKTEAAVRAAAPDPISATLARPHGAARQSPAGLPPFPPHGQQQRQAASEAIRQSLSPSTAAQPAVTAVTAMQPLPPQAIAAAVSEAVARPVTRIAPARGGADDARLTEILSIHGTASAQASPPVPAPPTQAQPPIDLRQDAGLARVIDHIETLRSGDTDRSRIRLTPDALGSVDISVRRDGDRVHIQFTTATAAAHSALADAAPRLAQLADARGVRLGQTGIDGGAADHGQPGQHDAHGRPSQPLRNIRADASESADSGDDDTYRIA